MGTDSKIEDIISQETGKPGPRYQVFLSFKSTKGGQPTKDSILAKEVFDFLCSRGIRAFYCTEQVGDPNFVRAINAALEMCQVMVVVAVEAEHLDSPWVAQEWRAFIVCHSHEEAPQIFTYVKNIMPKELPALLQPFTCIQHTGEESLNILCNHLARILKNGPRGPSHGSDSFIKRLKQWLKRRIKYVLFALLVLLVLIPLFYFLILGPFINKGAEKKEPLKKASMIPFGESGIIKRSITLQDLSLDIGRTKGVFVQMDPSQTRVNVRFQSLAEDGVLFLKAKGKTTFFELLGMKENRPARVVMKGRIAGSLKCGLRAELETADQMGYEIPTQVNHDGRFEASGQLMPETHSCRIIFERCSGPISGEIILSELTIRR